MDDKRKKEIQDALVARGALLPCARCGQRAFSVLDAYATVDQQQDFQKIIIGGPSIPCAVVACNNCGHISLHALGAIGLFKGTPPPPPPKGEPPPERSSQ
jgi:hypothetical protein